LDRLRDSNPLYSGIWRLLFGWWSDPLTTGGRVTLLTWSRMRNFGDQRQLVVADDGSVDGSPRPPTVAQSDWCCGTLARAMIASNDCRMVHG
jgi:hypothetical protein